MTHSRCSLTRTRGCVCVVCVITCIACAARISHAQVVVDKSFGRGGAVSGTSKLITPDMGRKVGGNLFHSFRTFNLSADESATFTGPNDVRNVIARVTGGKASTLAGDINVTIPGANFYFINPAGIIVAPGSTRGTINTDGAVVVTTAGYISMGKTGRFDAVTPEKSVLTAASPTAFGFVSRAPAKITVETTTSRQGLIAAEGKTLSVVGGDIGIKGNGATALFEARAGTINVVSVASPGTVSLDPSDPSSAIRLSGFSTLGHIDMSQGSISAPNGGSIHVRAQDVTMAIGSSISVSTIFAPGGTIDLSATGLVNLSGQSFLNADTYGPARGGTISVAASRIALADGLPSGDVVSAGSRILRNVAGALAGTGHAGDITLSARRIGARNGAEITSAVEGAGDGGTILVRARHDLLFNSAGQNNVTGVSAANEAISTGAGATITVSTPFLRLESGGEISSNTKGTGGAGSIFVDANQLEIDGFGPSAINANGLKQSQISARAGPGSSTTSPKALIDIRADSIRLTNSGVVSATTFGAGPGGDIRIRTGDLVTTGLQHDADILPFNGVFARSSIDPRNTSGQFGNGGSITIDARHSIVLRDGGQVSAISERSTAGAITLTAGESIELSEHRAGITPALKFGDGTQEPPNTRITVQALRGDSGNITLNTPGRIVLYNSLITAQARGAGGFINIDPPVIALNQSVINGKAIGPDANVSIDPNDKLVRSADSLILSRNQSVPPDIDLAGALIDLPASPFTRGARLEEICGVILGGNYSSFLVVGRGGTPVEPGGLAPSLDVSSFTLEKRH
jgi:filamentous hemagglutinin family protein